MVRHEPVVERGAPRRSGRPGTTDLPGARERHHPTNCKTPGRRRGAAARDPAGSLPGETSARRSRRPGCDRSPGPPAGNAQSHHGRCGGRRRTRRIQPRQRHRALIIETACATLSPNCSITRLIHLPLSALDHCRPRMLGGNAEQLFRVQARVRIELGGAPVLGLAPSRLAQNDGDPVAAIPRESPSQRRERHAGNRPSPTPIATRS